MTLRDLTLQELHHLHRHELREAFPPEELKPFAAMKKLYRAGGLSPRGGLGGGDAGGIRPAVGGPPEKVCPD